MIAFFIMDDLEKPIDFNDLDSILTRSHESDYGQLEYKYKLTDLTKNQKIRLTGQMKYRLKSDENYGQATYDIGLTDDGFALGLTADELSESLANLNEIAQGADAKICAVKKHTVTHKAKSEEDLKKYVYDRRFNGKGTTIIRDSAEKKREETRTGDHTYTKYVAEAIIRLNSEEGYVDLRIGIAGNVDAGKSTLLGVLTKGILDDGRGSARNSVFNFKHEVESGRTSSVGQQIMGFDDTGKSVADILTIKRPTWENIVKASTKIITFFDLAGHAPYLKTTIRGITSNKPDYCLIMIGANMGISKYSQDMTIEHISLCLNMKIPFIVVITKIDMCPPKILEQTITDITNLIKKTVKKLVYPIVNEYDVTTCAQKVKSGDVVPIFQISNVTGSGLELLKMFLNFIPVRKSFKKARKKGVNFQVQEVYNVPGVGPVVGGMLFGGTMTTNKQTDSKLLKLGPMSDGTFVDAYIRSIQCKTVSVQKANAGSWITIAVRVDKKLVKKGMFILSESLAKVTWEFTANVYINTTSSSNIKIGYQPHCHIGHITQTCKITDIVSIQQSARRKKMLAREGKIMIDSATLELLKTVSKEKDSIFSPEIKENILKSKMLIDPARKKISKQKILTTEFKKYLKSFIKKTELPSLGAGDFAEMKIRFCFRPEVIFDNDKKRFLFRENKTKGIGMIVGTSDVVLKPLSNKRVTKGNKVQMSRRERKEMRAKRQEENLRRKSAKK